MHARRPKSILRIGLLFPTVTTFLFIACNPAPAVVTNANDALAIAPVTSASAITPTPKNPLLIAGTDPIELPPFSCAPGFQFDVLGTTFCVTPDARDWHEAEATCQKQGGHLATLKTPAHSNALRAKLRSKTRVERFWIGLAEPSEGRWLWSNGTAATFFAWGNGEPNNMGRGEDCGNWETNTGRWNDADCFMSMHFLCESHMEATNVPAKPIACSGQRFNIHRHDYCLNAPTTWGDAQKQCVKDGGELAMIDSPEENGAIFAELGTTQPAGSFWIGLSDEAVEGQFRWIDGEPLREPQFRAGEPNNVANEDCIEWLPEDGLWNDLPCQIARPALCEKPATQIVK